MARYCVEEYKVDGVSLYRRWLTDLDGAVQMRMQARVQRFEEGNLGKTRHFASGLHEAIMDFGPGYRLYFGVHGHTLIVLLCGGSKSGQQADIDRAKGYWQRFIEESRHA